MTPARRPMGRIGEAILYTAMLATDGIGLLVATPFASAGLASAAYTLLFVFWHTVAGVLGFTALVSVVAAVVGSWRMKRRLVLWYVCIAASMLILNEQVKRSVPVYLPDSLAVTMGFMGLGGAWALAVAWLAGLARART